MYLSALTNVISRKSIYRRFQMSVSAEPLHNAKYNKVTHLNAASLPGRLHGGGLDNSGTSISMKARGGLNFLPVLAAETA